MRVVKVEFENRDAGPALAPTRWDCIWVDRDGVERIMEWYGSFYAGDDYTVYVNSKEVPQDINGELLHDTIAAEVLTPCDTLPHSPPAIHRAG